MNKNSSAPEGYRWIFVRYVYDKRTGKYIYPKKGKVLRILVKE